MANTSFVINSVTKVTYRELFSIIYGTYDLITTFYPNPLIKRWFKLSRSTIEVSSNKGKVIFRLDSHKFFNCKDLNFSFDRVNCVHDNSVTWEHLCFRELREVSFFPTKIWFSRAPSQLDKWIGFIVLDGFVNPKDLTYIWCCICNRRINPHILSNTIKLPLIEHLFIAPTFYNYYLTTLGSSIFLSIIFFK